MTQNNNTFESSGWTPDEPRSGHKAVGFIMGQREPDGSVPRTVQVSARVLGANDFKTLNLIRSHKSVSVDHETGIVTAENVDGYVVEIAEVADARPLPEEQP